MSRLLQLIFFTPNWNVTTKWHFGDTSQIFVASKLSALSASAFSEILENTSSNFCTQFSGKEIMCEQLKFLSSMKIIHFTLHCLILIFMYEFHNFLLLNFAPNRKLCIPVGQQGGTTLILTDTIKEELSLPSQNFRISKWSVSPSPKMAIIYILHVYEDYLMVPKVGCMPQLYSKIDLILVEEGL